MESFIDLSEYLRTALEVERLQKLIDARLKAFIYRYKKDMWIRILLEPAKPEPDQKVIDELKKIYESGGWKVEFYGHPSLPLTDGIYIILS